MALRERVVTLEHVRVSVVLELRGNTYARDQPVKQNLSPIRKFNGELPELIVFALVFHKMFNKLRFHNAMITNTNYLHLQEIFALFFADGQVTQV